MLLNNLLNSLPWKKANRYIGESTISICSEQRMKEHGPWRGPKTIINCLELRSSKRSIDWGKVDECQMINRSGSDHIWSLFLVRKTSNNVVPKRQKLTCTEAWEKWETQWVKCLHFDRLQRHWDAMMLIFASRQKYCVLH